MVNQSGKPEIVPDQAPPPQEINPEDVISKVLQVPDLPIPDINDDISISDIENQENQEEIKVKKKKFVPGGIKNRADLIRKIQESSEVCGNQQEVKAMRLHRRRRKSLDGILREQIAKCVTQEAEKRMGIPPEGDVEGRMAYAVECLYSFDLCCCKLVEKIVDYCDFGATVEGLSETIDSDPRIKKEIKASFHDWILENDSMEWIKTAASPSTRLLLCHLYPIVSCLKAKQANHKTDGISPTIQAGLATATLRNMVDPPRPRPKLPNGMRLV